jgi:hypothetical protein
MLILWMPQSQSVIPVGSAKVNGLQQSRFVEFHDDGGDVIKIKQDEPMTSEQIRDAGCCTSST